MARYAPLPIVSIDPQNEAQLVQLASQVVYEASNRTLNDFSAGNPLAALLEGQAFAQGEFLYWANQLPNKILIEWLGPFLGAMRRLGTPSVALVEVTIAPQNTATTIPAGTTFSTNSQLTNGVSIPFLSSNDLVIPAGESSGKVSVYSQFVGAENNCPANAITFTSSVNNVAFSATNPQPAVGGSDVETFQQVQERFFTLIRRPNPVSESDWQSLFIDLYGEGTLTSVQPNRSSQVAYNYANDYAKSNGQVSFFVLGPSGEELTESQLSLGQNVVNFSVPIENQGYLYPMTLSQVQYNLTLEVEANGTFGANFRDSSLNFRDRLYSVLTPGETFPADISPTVSDIDAAFYSTFDSNTRFRDPQIVRSSAYNTPNTLSKSLATYTQVYDFEPTSDLINVNDLIVVNNPNPTYYPALSDFTPYSINKLDQTIYGNLTLKQIKPLSAGSYSLGDIAYFDGTGDISQKGLHVILENISISSSSDILAFIAQGKISGVKTYSPWIVGNSYNYTVGSFIDPEIVEYDYTAGEFIPALPANVPQNSRPGSLAWLVTSDFTLQPSTNNITGALAQSLVGTSVAPQVLEPGNTYTAGTWVFTPQVGSGPNEVIDPNYHFVDITKGAVVKYAYVVSTFTYSPNSELISDYFDTLATQGTIQEIILFNGDLGLPIYRYKARFNTGQYLLYKESASSQPSYYIAAQYFSPTSNKISDLLRDGLVYNLAPTPALAKQLRSEMSGNTPGQINSISIADPGAFYTSGTYLNVPVEGNGDGFDCTVDVIVSGGKVTSVEINNPGQYYQVGEILTISNSFLGSSGYGVALVVSSLVPVQPTFIKDFQRMFTFFTGDRTFFREGNSVKSYTATEPVTPLFNFNVYYQNGIFVETGSSESFLIPSEEYIPFYDPRYALTAEDTILSEDGRNLYRVVRAFSPSLTVTSWSGTTEENTARFEEYAGNLLRYVSEYVCEESVLPQFGDEVSAIKLGIAQITIIPRNTSRQAMSLPQLSFVWENTSSPAQIPQLSWYTSTTFQYSPPNYQGGTLAL